MPRRTATVLIGLSLALAGCGGGDDDGGNDAEVEAREAVARFLDSFGDGDAQGACQALTPGAQDQVSGEIARVIRAQADQVGGEAGRALGTASGDCLSVLRAVQILFDVAPDTAAGTAALADQIREGDAVTVEIAGTTGTVKADGDRTHPAPVEVAEVDGEWLVADARTLLFGVP